MNTLRLYIAESFEELRNKITWPTWLNLQQTTGVVLLASLVLSILIFGMDTVSNLIMKFFYQVR